MFKVLLWDYTGVSAQWLDQNADKSGIEIVGMITPKEPVSEILLKRDAWDWLLIFEHGARNFFDATIQVLRLPFNKIICALDIQSRIQHPKAIHTLISDSGGGDINSSVA